MPPTLCSANTWTLYTEKSGDHRRRSRGERIRPAGKESIPISVSGNLILPAEAERG
jgi:hypothetical protein